MSSVEKGERKKFIKVQDEQKNRKIWAMIHINRKEKKYPGAIIDL